MKPDHRNLTLIARLTAHQDKHGRTYLRGLRRSLTVPEQLKILEAVDSRDLVLLVLPTNDAGTAFSLHVSRNNNTSRADPADPARVVNLEETR